jgi:hypothetical protein
MIAPLAVLGIGAAVYTGFKAIGKLFGSDPDFTQAWMMNRMTGQGGFLKTFFADGLRSMFLGSRTMSAALGAGMPMAGMLYGGGYMGGMNPYMANPYMMGRMPYSPMMMGPMMWGMR